ncbi:hypothetical protein J31TS3_41140 [Paenibacillus lactis]|nr:hypothetical protein J31TS3_41140 [Paenibacillus lactis]
MENSIILMFCDWESSCTRFSPSEPGQVGTGTKPPVKRAQETVIRNFQ